MAARMAALNIYPLFDATPMRVNEYAVDIEHYFPELRDHLAAAALPAKLRSCAELSRAQIPLRPPSSRAIGRRLKRFRPYVMALIACASRSRSSSTSSHPRSGTIHFRPRPASQS